MARKRAREECGVGKFGKLACWMIGADVVGLAGFRGREVGAVMGGWGRGW